MALNVAADIVVEVDADITAGITADITTDIALDMAEDNPINADVAVACRGHGCGELWTRLSYAVDMAVERSFDEHVNCCGGDP